MRASFGDGVGAAAQPKDASNGAIDYARESGGVIVATIFAQTAFRLLRGKPGGIAVKLLRRFPPRHLAKMGDDGLFLRGCGFSGGAGLTANVAGKRGFLYAAMNSGFFESLEGSSLGVGQSRFSAAFGESPASIATRPHQEKFDLSAADAVADSGYLLPTPQAAKLR